MTNPIRLFRSAFEPFTGKRARIQVAKTGEWKHPSYGDITFTTRDLDTMVRNFEHSERDVVLDYEHGTDVGTTIDSAIAAGWLRRLERVGNALWGEFEVTERAATYIQRGEFRLCSPTWTRDYKDKETGENRGITLLAAALTNRPFLEGMQPAICLTERAATIAARLLNEMTFEDAIDMLPDRVKQMPEAVQRVWFDSFIREYMANGGDEAEARREADTRATEEMRRPASFGEPRRQKMALHDELRAIRERLEALESGEAIMFSSPGEDTPEAARARIARRMTEGHTANAALSPRRRKDWAVRFDEDRKRFPRDHEIAEGAPPAPTVRMGETKADAARRANHQAHVDQGRPIPWDGLTVSINGAEVRARPERNRLLSDFFAGERTRAQISYGTIRINDPSRINWAGFNRS